MARGPLVYVLVLIECKDRNWLTYWVLVNVTFFSAGLVLSLKCRFHGNYTQQAHNVKMTSYQRQCDVITSHRR